MFFLGKRGPPAGGPHPYSIKLQPPRAEPLDGGRTAMHLRASRRSTGNGLLVGIFMALSGCWLLLMFILDERGEWLLWTLAMALGACAFFLYASFAYAIEKRLHTRRWRLRSAFLRVIFPGVPGVFVWLILLAVWSGLFLTGSYTWSPLRLFVALLGVSVSLFIGKIVQWILDSLVPGRVSRGPISGAASRWGEDGSPLRPPRSGPTE